MGWFAPVATMAAIGAAFLYPKLRPPELAVCTMLAVLAVNTLETGAGPFRKLLQHPLLLWAGALSFSLYLWQQIFYCFVEAGLPVIVSLPLVVICALWSFNAPRLPRRAAVNQLRNGPINEVSLF